MARHSRSDGSFVVLIILAVTVWTHRHWLLYVAYGLLLIAIILVAIKLLSQRGFQRRQTIPTNIDFMDGLDFERYVADLLKLHGFHNASLTEQYDMGVDIVAEKEGQRWGIQVKRYSGLVKVAAVRQVVTALKFYDCDRAMVVTNSTYSNVARHLAESNDCVLIDGASLAKLSRETML